MYGFDMLPRWAVSLIELAAGWIVLEVAYRSGPWRHARTRSRKFKGTGVVSWIIEMGRATTTPVPFDSVRLFRSAEPRRFSAGN
jgi:hypothetical protein